MYYQQSCEAVPSKADGKLVFLQLLRGRSKTQTKKTQTWRRCLLSCVLRLSECESSLSPCQPLQQQWKKKKKSAAALDKNSSFSSATPVGWNAREGREGDCRAAASPASDVWVCATPGLRRVRLVFLAPFVVPVVMLSIVKHTHTLFSIQKAWLSAPVSRAS